MYLLQISRMIAALYIGFLMVPGEVFPQVLATTSESDDHERLVVSSLNKPGVNITAVQQFKDTVSGFVLLANGQEKLAGEEVAAYRQSITNSFVTAYNTIVTSERNGETLAGNQARESMEMAIAEYMASPAAEKYTVITKDLDTYSTFMTKILITRALTLAHETE